MSSSATASGRRRSPATTERNVVQIADPALEPKSRPTDRRQVRRNLEAGYELELVPGSDTSPAHRAGFLDLYEQTMRRTGAAEHYFFGAAYFDRILEADRTWLALARAPGGELAAASIAAVSDGYLHYYLSGSADSHLRDSPMKNVVARLVEHSADARPPPQPRRRHLPRRRPRGVQARLRQPRAALAHLGDRLRPGAVRATKRRQDSRGPSSPPTAPSGPYSAGSAGVGPVNLKYCGGSPPYLPQVALPKARIASRVIAPL